jgi:hypothetical protein
MLAGGATATRQSAEGPSTVRCVAVVACCRHEASMMPNSSSGTCRAATSQSLRCNDTSRAVPCASAYWLLPDQASLSAKHWLLPGQASLSAKQRKNLVTNDQWFSFTGLCRPGRAILPGDSCC